MERTELLERVAKLEQEIRLLRETIEPPKPRTKIVRAVHAVLKFVASYWALLSFLAAILTIVYVQVEFGVDYFESYRNIATAKKLSAFYDELGDRMMVYNEWKAAQEAYGKALAINPNDVQATYGALKAQVFDPLAGDKFAAPEVVNPKLDYLLTHFPDDYQVYYLKGVSYLVQGDLKSAKEWFQRSVELNPQFVAGYVNLGYVSQGTFDLPAAVVDYEKALQLDPTFSPANNNLGFCDILLTQFHTATLHLERSFTVSPRLTTAINLGDAYRYAKDLPKAVAWHRLALSTVNDPDQSANERYMGSQWLYNYMPLAPGDLETIKTYVLMDTLDQKKAFVHYALSFDYALQGDFQPANREFEAARALDKEGIYNSFFVNQIVSIERLINPTDPDVNNWLEQHRVKLLTG